MPAVMNRAVLLALTALACEPKSERTEFAVTFRVNPSEPLAGVAISLGGGKVLGTTGPDGALRVNLAGRAGTTVPFRVRCPDGYRAPSEMPVLTLRPFTGLDKRAASAGIEVSIDCPPAERMAALVLRSGQPGLPVLAHGSEVARTDQDGVAHALVSLPPNTTFRVVIDTSSDPRLRPQNPATTITLPDSDEIFLIDQKFKVEEPPQPVAAAPVKKKVRKKKKKKVVKRPTGPDLPEKLK